MSAKELSVFLLAHTHTLTLLQSLGSQLDRPNAKGNKHWQREAALSLMNADCSEELKIYKKKQIRKKT